jgi:serine/threonine protein kinase
VFVDRCGLTEGLGLVDDFAQFRSVACVLAEMLRQRPLFCASSEWQMLEDIVRLCGFPTEQQWPAFHRLLRERPELDLRLTPLAAMAPCSVADMLPAHVPADVACLVEALLRVAPATRLTAAQALDHAVFRPP